MVESQCPNYNSMMCYCGIFTSIYQIDANETVEVARGIGYANSVTHSKGNGVVDLSDSIISDDKYTSSILITLSVLDGMHVANGTPQAIKISISYTCF
jgi:hypothetical protein